MNRHTKRTITSAVSALLVYAGIIELWQILLNRLKKRKATILVYHRVVDIDHDNFSYYEKNVSCSPAMFERQIVHLKKKFNIISLEQYVHAHQTGTSLPPSSVIITFDDGYRDIYINAYPILRKHDIPATQFVTTKFIEGRNLYWWDEISIHLKKTAVKSVELDEIGSFKLETGNHKRRAIEEIADRLTDMNVGKRKRLIDELVLKLQAKKYDEDISNSYVTWGHLHEMSMNNLKIGAHSVSHPNLKHLDNNKLLQELIECKQQIENELKKPVKFFAYPYGHQEHFDKKVMSAVKEAGFACACTTINGSANLEDNLFELRRIPIFHYNDMNVFKTKLSGILGYFDRLKNWIA